MPAWLTIVLQLMPTLTTLVQSIAGAVKGNAPAPTAAPHVLEAHANACGALDHIVKGLGDLDTHLNSMK